METTATLAFIVCFQAATATRIVSGFQNLLNITRFAESGVSENEANICFGEDVPWEEYPFIAYLYRDFRMMGRTKKIWTIERCTGFLLSENMVITAGHCVSYAVSDYECRLGHWETDKDCEPGYWDPKFQEPKPDEPGIPLGTSTYSRFSDEHMYGLGWTVFTPGIDCKRIDCGVAKIIRHPDFTLIPPGGRNLFTSPGLDVAAFFLKQPRAIKTPVRLWHQDRKPQVFQKITLSGMGANEPGAQRPSRGQPNKLRTASMEVVPCPLGGKITKKYKGRYGVTVTETITVDTVNDQLFCACTPQSEQQTCSNSGDSGGPWWYGPKNAPVIAGVHTGAYILDGTTQKCSIVTSISHLKGFLSFAYSEAVAPLRGNSSLLQGLNKP